MSQQTIAILGSGIAGLTLGRCLRQKGISSVIYEKASSAPRHTYGITLQPWAYKPLLQVLDLDEPTFRKLVAVDGLNSNGAGRIASGDPSSSTGFRANRNKLETILREGQTIHYDHALSSASIVDERSLEVRFQNDKTLRPTQIVDTLGVHSQLRKSLLPDASLEVQDFAVYSSKRYVATEEFDATYAPSLGDDNVLVRQPSEPGQPRLEITVNEHLSDGRISISYVYSRAARNDSGKPDPLHNPERPLAGATDIPEDFYQELGELVQSRKVGTPFAECFNVDKVRGERLLHWLMRTIIVPKQELVRLLQHGVVMIGDSAHAVPILGGHGANIAILDAIQLAQVFTTHGEARHTKLEEFYESNWQGWNEAVQESKRELAAMHQASSTNTESSL